MRWMWIDRVIELDRGRRLVAVKNVSLAEDHLHEHFAADETSGRAALPVVPATLIIEGMAQTAGILVGHAGGFAEKVVLAKITRAELDRDAVPGCRLRYTAEVTSTSASGASTAGTVDLAGPEGPFERAGRVDLVFSYLDRNAAGVTYPEHNFVFGESFKTLLRLSGIGA